MSEINTVIFDLDGVITDSAAYHYLAWKRLADEENLAFNEEVNEALKGVSRTDSMKFILAHNKKSCSDEELTDMAERKNAYYVEYIYKLTPNDLLPGIASLLKELKEKEIKIALGSASKNAKTVLNALEIMDYFDVIGDGYSVEKSKPAPDLFLHVAKQLGVDPCTCLVIEDAEAGIAAACSAGMKSIGIGPIGTLSKANIVVESPADIQLNTLISV